MSPQDINSLLIGYGIVCTLLFLFCMLTAHEDTVILRATEPNYKSDTSLGEGVIIIGCILFASFCPLFNIVLFINTLLYRKGLL